MQQQSKMHGTSGTSTGLLFCIALRQPDLSAMLCMRSNAILTTIVATVASWSALHVKELHV